MHTLRTATLVPVALALVACSELFGPKWAPRPGHIDSTTLLVPDTVTIGASFSVSFLTRGPLCSRPGNTNVNMVDARTAEVRPFDDVDERANACAAIDEGFQHSATLQFGLAGNATVRLIGANADTVVRSVIVH